MSSLSHSAIAPSVAPSLFLSQRRGKLVIHRRRIIVRLRAYLMIRLMQSKQYINTSKQPICLPHASAATPKPRSTSSRLSQAGLASPGSRHSYYDSTDLHSVRHSHRLHCLRRGCLHRHCLHRHCLHSHCRHRHRLEYRPSLRTWPPPPWPHQALP